MRSGPRALIDDLSNDPPAPWSFDPPAAGVDECVEVSDTDAGALGTVCAGDAPKTFTYSMPFGKHSDADYVSDPKKYNATWPDAAFFSSGQTYLQALSTLSDGNAYTFSRTPTLRPS